MNEFIQEQIRQKEQLINSAILKIIKSIIGLRRVPALLVIKICEYLFISPYRRYSLYSPVGQPSYILIKHQKKQSNKFLVENEGCIYLLQIIACWKAINKDVKSYTKHIANFTQIINNFNLDNTDFYCSQQNKITILALRQHQKRFTLQMQDNILNVLKRNYICLKYQTKLLLISEDEKPRLNGNDIQIGLNTAKSIWQVRTSSGSIWKRQMKMNRQRHLVRIEPTSKLNFNKVLQVQGPFCTELN